jgi:hypothetical protein
MMSMFGRKNIDARRSRRPASLALGVFAVVVSALFVVSFAQSVVAAENLITLKGEVVAVDSYGRTLTVKPIEWMESSPMGIGGEFTFAFDKMTNVMRCYQNKTLEDIDVGERVTVTYRETESGLVADAIDISPVFLACYDQ